MSLTMNQGGWTGKVLKVDLTARTATALDTAANFGQYWGGTGIGYKAIFDAVQARNAVTPGSGRSLAWYSPDAPVTLGWGPLTGTGALCGGRTSVIALSAQHVYSVPTTGHMGGHFSAQGKYAGWDSIIITGQASGPVYIAVKDDDVQIVDAPQLWHCGIFKVTEEITAAMGKGTQVAAIGQAGQNLVPQSCVMTGVSHSAGGVGAQLGAKNCVGVGVLGTGSVKIAASAGKWKSLLDYGLSIVGSNNQACVPNTLQSWAEYSPSSSGTRWWAYDGLYWGAADPPVNTGNCDPHDRQTLGYRCFKSDNAYGYNFTPRMDGCHACPVRCHQAISVPSAAKWGPKITAMNTCSGWWLSSWALPTAGNPTGAASLALAGSQIATQAVGTVIGAATIGGLSPTEKSLRALENYVVGHSVQDDYGITNNYGTVTAVTSILLNGTGSDGKNYDSIGTNGTVGVANTLGWHYIKNCVPATEWTSLTSSTGLLALMAVGDPTCTKEMGRLMAFKVGNFGTFVGGRCDEQVALWSNILSPLNDPATGAPFTSGSWSKSHTAGGDPQAPSYRPDTDLGTGGDGTSGATTPFSWGQMVRCSAPVLYWNWGFPKHHSWENCNQVGALQNTSQNRDAQNHVVVMMNSSGLPNMLARKVLDDQFAKYYTVDFPVSNSVTSAGNTGLTAGGVLTGMINSQDPGMSVGSNSKYNQGNLPASTPVNWAKARAGRFCVTRKELTDMLTVCGWMYPWFYSPLKERGYQGDISLEVQFFNAITGNNLSTLDLDHEGERTHTLHDVLTAYLWGQNNSGFGTNNFMIPGAWVNKSAVAEGALGVAAGSSPSAPGMQAISGVPVSYGGAFGSPAFSPFVAPLTAISFTNRPMNTTTYSWRVQHDLPCPAWGIAAATGIGGSGNVAYTVGGGQYGTYADWTTSLQLMYQVNNYDYLDGTHTTNSGLPTTSAYALLGMNASGTINVQQFMSDAGLLPW